MNNGNPRFDRVTAIRDSKLVTILDAKLSNVKAGDALVLHNENHIIWVAEVHNDYLLIFEQAANDGVAKWNTVKTSEFSSSSLEYNGETYTKIYRPN